VAILSASPRFLFADSSVNDNNNASTLEWLRDQRNDWGKLVGSTGKRLDGFFATESSVERSNDSFIKVSLRGQQSSGGSSTLKPEFKFRLDLPSLKDRLKLVLESSPSEKKTLEESTISQPDLANETVKDSAIGALELIAPRSHHFSGSTSIGLDFKLPADPFWRAKASYRWDISKDWDFTVRENIYYFHESGWGESSTFTFQYTQSAYVLRTASEAKYSHVERTFDFAQVFSVINELSPKDATNTQFGALGENKPKPQTTSYFIKSTYRHRLHSTWLFYEITPQLNFPRDDNFNLVPSLSAKIELVFSDKE